MPVKKYDQGLAERVKAINNGLGPQVLSQLWAIQPGFREKRKAAKLRRILSGRCHPGDALDVSQMEAVKELILEARELINK